MKGGLRVVARAPSPAELRDHVAAEYGAALSDLHQAQALWLQAKRMGLAGPCANATRVLRLATAEADQAFDRLNKAAAAVGEP